MAECQRLCNISKRVSNKFPIRPSALASTLVSKLDNTPEELTGGSAAILVMSLLCARDYNRALNEKPVTQPITIGYLPTQVTTQVPIQQNEFY